MITIIDRNGQKHTGKLIIENLDVFDLEITISHIVEAVENLDFDLGFYVSKDLPRIIKDYQEMYEGKK